MNLTVKAHRTIFIITMIGLTLLLTSVSNEHPTSNTSNNSNKNLTVAK